MKFIKFFAIFGLNFNFITALTCDEKISKLSLVVSNSRFDPWRVKKVAVKFIDDVWQEYQLYGFGSVMNCNYNRLELNIEGIYIYDTNNVEHYCPQIYVPFRGVKPMPMVSFIIASNHSIVYDVVKGKYAVIYTCVNEPGMMFINDGLFILVDANAKLTDFIDDIRKVCVYCIFYLLLYLTTSNE